MTPTLPITDLENVHGGLAECIKGSAPAGLPSGFAGALVGTVIKPRLRYTIGGAIAGAVIGTGARCAYMHFKRS